MSDVINGVPRELLERLLGGLDEFWEEQLGRKWVEQARALLTAQPQASAAQSAPDEREDWGVFASYLLDKCEGDTISEEGLQRALHSMFHDPHYGPLFRREGEQRAQSAPAGAVREPIFFVDPDYVRLLDGRTKITATLYANSASGGAMPVYAAPQPAGAAGEYGDAYQGAREDLAIWKRRALEAEEKVRHQEQIIDHLTLEAQGETRMGEPVIPAARQEQGDEVRGLREALELARPCVIRDMEAAVRENFGRVGNDPWACAAVDARDAIDAALSASAEGGVR